MDKYQKGETLGQGQFGTVIKATVKETGEVVAIKKVKLANFKEGIDVTALREIKILRELKSPHIIRLIDVFTSNRNLALVLELMESDLEAVIKDSSLVLSAADVKSYMQMALQALEVCHANNVVHRDIKPNNLLIAKSGALKLADFGLAKVFGSPEGCCTSQVFARWYRAPELIWGSTSYGAAVDVWAMGCVFAELVLRRPWFPGESDIKQLEKIFSVLGTPTAAQWAGMHDLPSFLEFTAFPAQPLHKVFPQLSEDALDLLSQMMQFDPSKRISASKALQHRFFTRPPAPTPAARLPRPISRADAPLLAPPTAASVHAAKRPADGEAENVSPLPSSTRSGEQHLQSAARRDVADQGVTSRERLTCAAAACRGLDASAMVDRMVDAVTEAHSVAPPSWGARCGGGDWDAASFLLDPEGRSAASLLQRRQQPRCVLSAQHLAPPRAFSEPFSPSALCPTYASLPGCGALKGDCAEAGAVRDEGGGRIAAFWGEPWRQADSACRRLHSDDERQTTPTPAGRQVKRNCGGRSGAATPCERAAAAPCGSVGRAACESPWRTLPGPPPDRTALEQSPVQLSYQHSVGSSPSWKVPLRSAGVPPPRWTEQPASAVGVSPQRPVPPLLATPQRPTCAAGSGSQDGELPLGKLTRHDDPASPPDFLGLVARTTSTGNVQEACAMYTQPGSGSLATLNTPDRDYLRNRSRSIFDNM